jgi:Trk K+ transport system NAD-binding subunit
MTGMEPLGGRLEVAELRVHSNSTLGHSTLAAAAIRAQTGAHIVGQWRDDALRSPPAADQILLPGAILVAAGTPESIQRLSQITRPITQEGPLVVAGFGEVGQKLAEILHDAGQQVCVIDTVQRTGVDIVGDILDPGFLERTPIAAGRVVILALDSDSTTLLAVTVVRAYAPDVPIIASATHIENVGRMQRAGADFALSVSQVAGQLLAYHVLGEVVAHQLRIKLVKLEPGHLVGRKPLGERIRERTGCTVVAVERESQILMDIAPSFVLAPDDALYLCGTTAAFNRYYEEFSDLIR